MSALPEKTGIITLDLEERGSRAEAFSIGAIFVLGSLACSPVLAGGSWFLCLFLFLACIPAYYLIFASVHPLLGAAVRMNTAGLEFLRKGKRQFAFRWDEVKRVERYSAGFLRRRLRFIGPDDHVLGEVPLSSRGLEAHQLTGLISKHLAAWTPMYTANPRKVRGTLASKSISAGLLTVSSVVAFSYASQLMVANYRLSGVLLLASIGAFSASLVMWAGVFSWRRRAKEQDFLPLQPLFGHSLLSDIKIQLSGRGVARKCRYRYSTKVIDSGARNSRFYNERAAGLSAIFASVLGLACIAPFTIPTFMLVVAPLVLGAVTFAGTLKFKRGRQEYRESMRARLPDEVEVEHLAIWVIRAGKRLPARVVANPAWQTMDVEQGGFRRMRIPLEVAGETCWYDPSSMFDEPGLALLEASRGRIEPSANSQGVI